MQTQAVIKPPPIIPSAVVLAGLFEGRYVINAGIEVFDTEGELVAWLKYSNMLQMLIDRILRDLRERGMCILSYKGIVITDTEWRKPVQQLDWSAFSKSANS